MFSELSTFYSSLATIFLIIALGFFVAKKKWIDEHTNKTIINLLMNVAWPAALLLSFPGEFSFAQLENFLWGAAGGVLILAVVIFLSKILFRKKKHPRNYFEYQFAFIFNNASFLGFPLIMTLYGENGLVPYGGFIVVFNLALFGYGVALFRENFSTRELLKTFLNPNIIAVFLGLLLFLFSFQLPEFLDRSVNYVGAIMTPLSLICIGFMLSRANFHQIFSQKILVGTALAQLIFDPIVTFLILQLIGAPAIVIQVLVLIQALPTATSLGLFAEKYRSNSASNVSHASELVAISTALSIVTVPAVVGILFSLI